MKNRLCQIIEPGRPLPPEARGEAGRARHAHFPGLLIAALALSACAGPHYLTRSCLTHEQLEQLKAEQPPKIHDKLTGKADEDTRPLAGSIIQLRSYSGMLLGVLETCAGPPGATK